MEIGHILIKEKAVDDIKKLLNEEANHQCRVPQTRDRLNANIPTEYDRTLWFHNNYAFAVAKTIKDSAMVYIANDSENATSQKIVEKMVGFLSSNDYILSPSQLYNK